MPAQRSEPSAHQYRHSARGQSNRDWVTCVTDSRSSARSYWHGMSTQHRMRSVLSGMLAVAILSCAQTALATPILSTHAVLCRARMSQVRQPAMPPSCKHHTNAAPCCPSNSVTAAAHCMERPGCCKLSNQPALPLAFLIVSRAPLALELSASRSADVDLDLRPSRRTPPAADSPPFLKPVFDQKADLRI
jgi:hypothetical protein